MKGISFSRGSWDIKEGIFFALSCRHRLNIVKLLLSGEKTTQDIANHFRIHPSVLSRHLNVLLSFGLISVRKEGVRAYWRIAEPGLSDLLRISDEIAKSIALKRGQKYKSYIGG
jgi:DNA-binding transcriptional ArsR family regulator